jgi:low temperature requirement protein LtrA
MAGVLVLAAGVPSALEHSDYGAVTLGYAIMRTGLVAHWLRAAIEDPSSRVTALRYALGITVLEVGWVTRWALDAAGLLPDDARLAVFAALVLCELSVPLWAERRHATSWHPHHIAERYGLFAIILFGESVFAASMALEESLASGGLSASLVVIGLAALILVFALWWIYFLQEAGEGLVAHRERSYLWGYGHYFILAALAAVGAGLELAVEQAGHGIAASATTVGYAIAIPVALFLLLTWALHAPIMPRPVLQPGLLLGSCLAILVLPAFADGVGVATVLASIAAVCAAVVAVTLARKEER